MIDPNNIEECAKDSAGALGGAYLDEIKKTDLATLTKEEWKTFIDVVIGGYVSNLCDAQAKANAAAAKVQTSGDPPFEEANNSIKNPSSWHEGMCPWHGGPCNLNCDAANVHWCEGHFDQELPATEEEFNAMKKTEMARLAAGL